MSDLHLEVGPQYKDFHIRPQASQLILAGDIGRLADYDALCGFLRAQCANFTHVFYVLGNHEFFGISRAEGLRLAESLQQEPGLMGKLTIMNRKRVDLQNATLLGCTLHSRIPTDAEEVVRNKINDFRRIVGWTVACHVAEHQRDVAWLIDEVASIRRADSQRTIVVITHHAPSTRGTSRPSDESNPWSSAFGTDLLADGNGRGKTCLDDVQWWIFGHTHHSSESVRGQVRLVSNQRGYAFPRKDKGTDEPEASESFGSKVSRLFGVGDKQRQRIFNPDKVIEF